MDDHNNDLLISMQNKQKGAKRYAWIENTKSILLSFIIFLNYQWSLILCFAVITTIFKMGILQYILNPSKYGDPWT